MTADRLDPANTNAITTGDALCPPCFTTHIQINTTFRVRDRADKEPSEYASHEVIVKDAHEEATPW